MKEKELIQNLRKGKEKAYVSLFSKYYEWLCNYVFQLSGDRDLAEDIVQEVIVGLWEKRKNILITTSLKSYLFRSCHNQFLQHLRKKKIQFDRLDEIQWDVITEINIEENIKELRIKKLNTLIDQLPQRCKQIFILSKLEKKKYKEIAVDMGISIKTVENQMSKALHFLRENAVSLLIFFIL